MRLSNGDGLRLKLATAGNGRLRVEVHNGAQDADGVARIEERILVQVVAGDVPWADGVEQSEHADDRCSVADIETVVGVIVGDDLAAENSHLAGGNARAAA